MINIIALLLVVAFSGLAEAAHTIYLKNGSVIRGISSFESRNDEVILYIGGGSIGINKDEILKIEETGNTELDIRAKESIDKGEVPMPAPHEEDRGSSIKMLQDELGSVTTEIRKLEIDEGRLVEEINQKRGRRFKYNIYQLKQLEKEIEPLQKELYHIQQKKNELLERRSAIENELRTLQR